MKNDISTNEADVVSIIISIYNVEQYLKKCIDSVINQSYKNIEIILVVGDSGDHCEQICKEYEKLDGRIKAIYGQNNGRSNAREVGLQMATGSYLTFLDGDDTLDSQFTMKMITAIKKYNCDIAACNSKDFYEKDGTFGENLGKEEYMEYSGEEAICTMWYETSMSISFWGKLYKKEVWNGLHFQHYKNYDDLAIMHHVCLRSSKIVYIPSYSGVNHVIRYDSGTWTITQEMLHDLVYLSEEVIRFSKSISNNMYNAAIAIAVSGYFHALMTTSSDQFQDIRNFCKTEIKKYRRLCLCNPKVKIKTRVALLLSYLGFPVVSMIYNIFDLRGKSS